MARIHSTLDKFVVDYDHQREWIERRGLLLLLAIYLGGVGGGLFLASLIVGWKTGLAIALGVVVIGKGGAHLLYLGKPLRVWRAFGRPQSSWLSRGLYVMILFALTGLLYYFSFDGGNSTLLAISGFFGLALVTYTGFMMAASRGITFWNNPLLPVIFASASLSSGTAMAAAAHAFQPEVAFVNGGRLEPLGLFLTTATALLVLIYLMVNYGSTLAGKESVTFLALSRFAPVFYAGVVVLGLIIPLAVLVPAYMGAVSEGWLAVAGISELAGSLILRYSLLKAGIFPKVI